MKRSGPVHRLGAKLSEIQAGLRSVQKRLEQQGPTVTHAKITQKVGSDVEVDSKLFSISVSLLNGK